MTFRAQKFLARNSRFLGELSKRRVSLQAIVQDFERNENKNYLKVSAACPVLSVFSPSWIAKENPELGCRLPRFQNLPLF